MGRRTSITLSAPFRVGDLGPSLVSGMEQGLSLPHGKRGATVGKGPLLASR